MSEVKQCHRKAAEKVTQWLHSSYSETVAQIIADCCPAQGDEKLAVAARALLDAMETCHVCKGVVLLDEWPIHCEDCPADCDDHEAPDCIPIRVLHTALRRALPAPSAEEEK